MIGFAPLDFDEGPPPTQKPISKAARGQFSNERTECNYLVLFFVIGVFLLALGDMTKR